MRHGNEIQMFSYSLKFQTIDFMTILFLGYMYFSMYWLVESQKSLGILHHAGYGSRENRFHSWHLRWSNTFSTVFWLNFDVENSSGRNTWSTLLKCTVAECYIYIYMISPCDSKAYRIRKCKFLNENVKQNYRA